MSSVKRPTARATKVVVPTKMRAPAVTPDAAKFEAILAAAPSSPFSDAVLPNAFRETPDVPSIHGDARQRCLSLVRDARDAGRTSLQVIAGAPGEGKTHLIAWLRRQSEEAWRKDTETGRFALTVVPPLRSLTSARHHVLQEVVRQLSIRLSTVHVDEATDTPIEILLWRAFHAIARLIVAEKSTPADLRGRLEDAVATNPNKFLSSFVQDLRHAWPLLERGFVDAALRLPALAPADREVFRVLARFPRGDDADRTAIVDWLGGASISAERLEALGTALVLDEEAEAGRGLKTLLVLAHLAATPVALAFDQIEGIPRLGQDAITIFLDTIADLYNDCPSTVILLFCQTQVLPMLREQATEHARDRLDDLPPLHLKGLTPDEAFLLVETRMRHFWEGATERPTDLLFPLSRERVLAEVERGNLRSARGVVRYFHQLLREPPEQRKAFVAPAAPPPADVVRRKLDALVEDEAKTARPPDTRAEVTQSVVFDLLEQAQQSERSIGEVRVREVERHRASKTSMEGVRLVVERGSEKKRVYLESSNREHGKSTASTMKRFASVIEANQADVAVLLREEAFPLPPASKKALVELGPRGVMLRLGEGEIPPLAAIEALLNAAAAGDVPVNRKTALDIAVAHLDKHLGIQQRIVDAVLPAAPAVVPAPSVKRPSVDIEVPPTSRDPALVAQRTSKILEHLRLRRPFEPVAQLASTLGLSLEAVHADLQELVARGEVEIATDRNRAAVALLRPEAVAR